METPTPYRIANSPDKYPERRITLDPYFKTVKDILCSLTLGYETDISRVSGDPTPRVLSYATDEELCDRAMAIADTLIEKVGEKL